MAPGFGDGPSHRRERGYYRGAGNEVSLLVNSTFSGGGDGVVNGSNYQTGDNRGYYVGAQTMANFDPVYPELDIEISFGWKTGNQIEVMIQQLIAFDAVGMDSQGNWVHYTRVMPAPPCITTASISGNTPTVNNPMFVNREMTSFEIKVSDADTLEFEYNFNGVNAYSGFGVVRRNGSSVMDQMRLDLMVQQMTPPDLPIQYIPKIGWGVQSLTVTDDKAIIVESGEWNGVVQLRFTNPNPPTVKQIEVL